MNLRQIAMHKLLIRQLNREGLSDQAPPQDLSQWLRFIERVNNTYDQADQERYLLERSMDISSSELLGLNEKLEEAQHIAKLGYWLFDPAANDLIWSKELYALFGIDSALLPSWQDFLRLIHEQDRQNFAELAQKALQDGTNYDCEVRIVHSDTVVHWFYMIAQPFRQPEQDSYGLSGVAMEITARKQAQEKISVLQDELLLTARHAGMAEVATSVLHNVGNILNSTNVSLGLLQENMNKPYYRKLFMLRDMIKKHLSTLVVYLTEDPQGRVIPDYFIAMTDVMEAEHQAFSEELTTLSQHISHIKEIITMQQTLGGAFGVIVKLFLPEMIDTALQMCLGNFSQKNIQIIRDYRETPFMTTDKIKLLQIFVNLIQNAKEAVLANGLVDTKEITITINKINTNEIDITFTDNGVGIRTENLTKIFSFGFTTKKTGHGFGLHNCALAAKELGGALTAKSDGENTGATFTLTLPVKN